MAPSTITQYFSNLFLSSLGAHQDQFQVAHDILSPCRTIQQVDNNCRLQGQSLSGTMQLQYPNTVTPWKYHFGYCGFFCAATAAWRWRLQ
jgi:hypothetical protein